MRNVYERYLATTCVLLIAPLFPGIVSAAPPDMLGVTVGMAPGDAYNAVKAADVTHRVTVQQIAIPELLGERSAVYKMGPDTLDPLDVFYVNLTLPPSPQVVWQVYHQLQQLHITQAQALASLTSKFGAKYRSRAPFTPTSSVGVFRWIYDEQGNLSDMPFSQEAKCTPTTAPMNPLQAQYNGPATPGPAMRSIQPDVQIRPIPAVYNPDSLPECQHLVWVDATIQGTGLLWAITITISDFDLEHRNAIPLVNFLNALATKQQNRELNQAEHTTVPKL